MLIMGANRNTDITREGYKYNEMSLQAISSSSAVSRRKPTF